MKGIHLQLYDWEEKGPILLGDHLAGRVENRAGNNCSDFHGPEHGEEFPPTRELSEFQTSVI